MKRKQVEAVLWHGYDNQQRVHVFQTRSRKNVDTARSLFYILAVLVQGSSHSRWFVGFCFKPLRGTEIGDSSSESSSLSRFPSDSIMAWIHVKLRCCSIIDVCTFVPFLAEKFDRLSNPNAVFVQAG